MPLFNNMRLTIGELRVIVRQVLGESMGNWASAPQPMGRTPGYEPDIVNRQQIGKLQSGTPDPDEVDSHLLDPVYSEEECYGPVPPKVGDPWVQQDPYVRFSSPLPTFK